MSGRARGDAGEQRGAPKGRGRLRRPPAGRSGRLDQFVELTGAVQPISLTCGRAGGAGYVTVASIALVNARHAEREYSYMGQNQITQAMAAGLFKRTPTQTNCHTGTKFSIFYTSQINTAVLYGRSGRRRAVP
eukprot:SAG22_NODE_1104_length_5557_cov_11.548369_1_plen_133_part_00